MLGVQQILDQYAWLYQDKIPMPGAVWDWVIPIDGCYCAVYHTEELDYLMFRGSVTNVDWVQDIDKAAAPYDDPLLGPVHPGGAVAVMNAKPVIEPMVGRNYVVVGHSLGAIHAALYAGYRTVEGAAPRAMFLFGEPQAGTKKLSRILAEVPVTSQVNADGNGHDRICNLPPWPDFCHVRDPLQPVSCAPPADDEWGLFSYHHMGLYARANGCTSPQTMALKI